MFSLFSKKAISYFSAAEQDLIVQAIRDAELSTSGEVRVYIESRCAYVDPVRRAKEIFGTLKMHETAARNAALVYVAMKDRQLAVFGDEGIHQKVGDSFWNAEVKNMLLHFNKQDYASGIAGVVRSIGKALETHFPYEKHTDKNELPDEIVFGK
ncbi:MAG: TPM domain-containing protein [Bacteroidota bacterium]